MCVTSATNREWTLGYALRPDEWGHGYMTEAASALVRFRFEWPGRASDRCHEFAANSASIRVLEKLDMLREGVSRQQFREGDHWRDTYEYAVLDDECGKGAAAR